MRSFWLGWANFYEYGVWSDMVKGEKLSILLLDIPYQSHQNPLGCSINETSLDGWADMYFCSYVSCTNCVHIALWHKKMLIMMIINIYSDWYICRYQQLTTQHPYVLKSTISDMFRLCYISTGHVQLLFWILPLSIL